MEKKTRGAMIAALRKDKGMTQLELAEKMGVTDKAVSKWERDVACPDVTSLPRLAELLGVSVDELMQGQTEKKSSSATTKLINDILRYIPLAMGIAVAVLSFLKKLDPASGLGMLGIGMVCIGIVLLPREKDEE